MKALTIVILAIVTLSMTAEAKLVDITGTHDSKMRPYLEPSFGGVPSAGHWTYWAVNVKSTDKPKFVNIGFAFDNRKEVVRIWVVPNHETYVSAAGYMKTFTNQVHVTLEPPYN